VTQPILYEFPHSHFCEVARWALDYKGISYRSKVLFPGYHLYQMKAIAPQSSLPVLRDGRETVQGSQAILDHLDRKYRDKPLAAELDIEQIHQLENEIADSVGVPLRRLCYAYLLDRPDLVRYFFMHRSSRWQNLLFALVYPMLRKRLREVYDCTPAGAARAKEEIARAFDRFDRQLEGRDYLMGDSFSRVDMTFASLAVFIAMPSQYPVAWPIELNNHELTDWLRSFRERPSYRHVEKTYANHRQN
jgi:glutathione S-transferase